MRPLVCVLCWAALVGCDDDLPPEDCASPEGACQTIACAPPLEEGTHVEFCSRIGFHSNPPTSGPHYPIWADFKAYDIPVPRGLYLHSIEHSGIVLAYNCDLVSGDCDALTQSLVDVRNAYGRDDDCSEATMNRIVVTPDPDLDVPFAAAAWGHSLRGQCVDRTLVDAFIDAYYGDNYEDTCASGIDPSDPGSGITPDCGR